MYSVMCFPQRREVPKQGTVHLEVLLVEEEIQWPGDGVVQGERRPKEEIVKCNEFCVRGTLTQGWEQRAERT